MTSAVLAFIQTQTNYYGHMMLIIFGITGNACIVILFSQRYRNFCAFFLLCAAVMNSANLMFHPPINIYTVYHEDIALRFLIICKLRFYLSHAWTQSARSFIMLACIDRFLLTTNNARYRAFSRSLVQRSIIATVLIFWHIFAIQLLIMTTVANEISGLFDLYSIVFFAYYAIAVCIIPPTVMSICGTLAYRHMRHLHARVRPMGNLNNENPGNGMIHRADRQLLIMTISETTVYVTSPLIYPIIYLKTGVTKYIGITKSPDQLQIESFLSAVGSMLLYFNSAVPFYTYLVVSSAFRRDVKQFLTKLARRLTGRSNAVLTQKIPQMQS